MGVEDTEILDALSEGVNRRRGTRRWRTDVTARVSRRFVREPPTALPRCHDLPGVTAAATSLEDGAVLTHAPQIRRGRMRTSAHGESGEQN